MGDLLVLWDVDGTLLNAGGIGADLYDAVFQSMFGRPCTEIPSMAGRTDRSLILDTLEMAGIPEPRRHVDLFIEGLRARAQSVLPDLQERGQVLPGAAEAIAALASATVGGSAIGFAVPGVSVPPDGEAPVAGPVTASAPAARSRRVRAIPEVVSLPADGAHAPVNTFLAATALPFGSSAASAQASLGAPAPLAAPGTALAPSAPPAAVPPPPVIPPPVIPPPAIPPPAIPAPGIPAPMIPAPMIPADAPEEPPVIPSPAVPAVPADTPQEQARATLPVSSFPVPSRVRSRPGRVHQSVLTGNVRPLAEVKLTAMGLRHALDLCIGAYGDDHEIRTELVHLARRRAAGVYGESDQDFAGEATIVVGDTPLDIEAALAAGARAVGVATGPYSAADLDAAGAHAVLPDLRSTPAVLTALLAQSG